MDEWIGCRTDNYPEEDKHVLLRFESGGLSEYSIGFCTDMGDWLEIHGDHCVMADMPPTHWRPLPEPPCT